MIMEIHSFGNDFLIRSTVLFYCQITTCMLQIPLIVPQKFMLSVHSSLIAIQMEEVEEGEEESEKMGNQVEKGQKKVC